MKLHSRHQPVALAKTKLELKITEYFDERKIYDYVEVLRAVTFEMRNILLDMEPKVARANTFSDLKDLIRAHQQEHELTDIETLQALASYVEGSLKYMLRWERHGNYDKAAGVE